MGRKALIANAVAGLVIGALSIASAQAGTLSPIALNADRATNAVGLGTAMGERRAWAAFSQEVGGSNRLYVTTARNGIFRGAELADRGNAIEGGGLAGDRRRAAVVVFTETVNNEDVLFSRRLEGGRVGDVRQVSPDGEDVESAFEELMFPFERNLGLTMNENGAAALCYTDAVADKSFVAILPPDGEDWERVEVPNQCYEPGIDSRGNVAALTSDANADPAVVRVTGGQVDVDTLDPDLMDQISLDVSPAGMAIAVGRDNMFHVRAYVNGDIAASDQWEKSAELEQGLLIDDGRSPEDPFVRLNADGDGILVFRDNAAADARGYYRRITGGGFGPGGEVFQSATTAGRLRPAVDADGNAYVAYATDDFQAAALRRLVPEGLTAEEPLGPQLPSYTILSLAAISVNDPGDLLVLVLTNDEPRNLHAVFGDWQPPSLKPKAKPRRPKVGERVKLNARATDTFAKVRSRDVSWSLPRGARRAEKGKKIKVRFSDSGKQRVKVTARDRAGNKTREKLTVKVR